MSPRAEFKILELCKGLTLKQVERRLAIMQSYCDAKQLNLRLKVTGLNIGD